MSSTPKRLPWSTLLPLYATSLRYSVPDVLRMLRSVLTFRGSEYFSTKPRPRPEILNDPDLGTHGFAKLKDVTLHYVAKGDESRPLMLFLHGYPEFWYSWRHQLKEFGGDFRAVAVDMRGYGDSSKPSNVSDYTVDKLVSDVRELVNHLGYDKCILVGHDWGGNVAWSSAMMQPDMVERLIVCNAGHPSAFRKHLMTSPVQQKMSRYMTAFQMPYLPEYTVGAFDFAYLSKVFTGEKIGARRGTFSKEELEAYKFVQQSFADRTAPLDYYRALAQCTQPSIASRTIKAPTLLIWGTKDAFLGKEMAELSRKYVKDFTLRFIEASHWIQVEEPAKVNEYMRRFLSRSVGAVNESKL